MASRLGGGVVHVDRTQRGWAPLVSRGDVMRPTLIACGQALYGQQWQSALARDLDVSDRTMRRWAAGAQNVPDGIYLELMRLCVERAAYLDDLVARLKKTYSLPTA